eukprot:1174341-Prorocentrum_minimum.AAC.1
MDALPMDELQLWEMDNLLRQVRTRCSIHHFTISRVCGFIVEDGQLAAAGENLSRLFHLRYRRFTSSWFRHSFSVRSRVGVRGHTRCDMPCVSRERIAKKTADAAFVKTNAPTSRFRTVANESS